MLETIVVSGSVLLSLFGGVIVPSLMGVCLRIERIRHRNNLAGLSPDDQEGRRHLTSTDREHTSRFAPRHLERSDLSRFWPRVAILFVVLMPFATWIEPLGDDFLFALHPIVCVGWWLSMRSRGIIHAEVYALSVWILAYTAWSLSVLAPLDHPDWRDLNALDGDFVSFVAYQFGITSDLALTLWLLYVASGIACVLAGIILAQSDRPLVPPLLAVAVWIPFVWGVMSTNYLLGFLGLVMAVGVAGYGISREVRISQDDADIRAGAAIRRTRSALRWKTSKGLVLRTAAVIVVAVAISISVRESGMSVPGAELAATWSALLLAPAATALLARLDRRPRVASEWAAWAWLATVSVLAGYHLTGPSSTLFLVLTQSGESRQLEESIDMLISLQAIVVWLVAVVLVVVTDRAGKLRSYGALLLGLLWFPIATFSASLYYAESSTYPLPDAVSSASMVAMGCVLLVIMWRFFGPAGETAGIDTAPSAVVLDDDSDGPALQTGAVRELQIAESDIHQSNQGAELERPSNSVPGS